VWVVQPLSRTVTVHRPGEEPLTLGLEDSLEGGDILPGLALPVRVLFD
jgi:hypothetical protein